MLASEPGEVASQLTVDGPAAHHPRRHRCSSPRWSRRYIGRERVARLVELLARLVISLLPRPVAHVDLGDADVRPTASSAPSSCPRSTIALRPRR